MKTLSYTQSRARYAEVPDSVLGDREEVVITRAGHDPAVIVSVLDYEALKETAYLMRSPPTAADCSTRWSAWMLGTASNTT